MKMLNSKEGIVLLIMTSLLVSKALVPCYMDLNIFLDNIVIHLLKL